jgi:hypothetical protein
VTWWPNRSSISGSAAALARRYPSTLAWEMLIQGGSAAWPENLTVSTSCSR